MRSMILALVAVLLVGAAPAFAAGGDKGDWELGAYYGFGWLDDYGMFRPDDDNLYGARLGTSSRRTGPGGFRSAHGHRHGIRLAVDPRLGEPRRKFNSLRLNLLYNFAGRRWDSAVPDRGPRQREGPGGNLGRVLRHQLERGRRSSAGSCPRTGTSASRGGTCRSRSATMSTSRRPTRGDDRSRLDHRRDRERPRLQSSSSAQPCAIGELFRRARRGSAGEPWSFGHRVRSRRSIRCPSDWERQHRVECPFQLGRDLRL